MLAYLHWNPERIAFVIPWVNHPVAWYGVLWFIGFSLGYLLFVRALPYERKVATAMADRLLWYLILGTVVGARLGNVFFYDWPRYAADPLEVFRIWNGGLASHGGTVGVIVALYLFSRTSPFSLLELMDRVAVPTALVAALIRFGNFINQEILGTVTTKSWGVIFGHEMVARHPVQLYEAAAYLFLFGFLYRMQQRPRGVGLITGLFFTICFGARFSLEFFKAHDLSSVINESTLSAGQWLSLPFIAVGIWISIRAIRRNYTTSAHSGCSP